MTSTHTPTKRPFTLAYGAGYNDGLWGFPRNPRPWDDSPTLENWYHSGFSAGRTEAALNQEERREELDRQRSRI